ncbi:MAG: response regulator receiver protein [Desulfovibrio sp.]|uniref:response regulator receiver protein n=1 Tax=Desulfovibrio sp. TaxID=885 RepID=UPI00135E5C24|nr:response regulator receiver protein [Desulfovibrio sp.]MTJ94305.1 response regulator receiver protein [Desulfovibrio sp.]
MKRSILLQTGRPAVFAPFVRELERQGCTVTTVADAAACKDCVQRQAPQLVVVDAPTHGQARQDVIGIMRVNALVHTAVVTDMAADAFHDAMEGLGILTSLPPAPGADDARRLLQLLNDVMA